MATGTQTDIQSAIVETKNTQVAQFAPEPEAVKALVERFTSILSYSGAEKLNDKEKITLAFNCLAYNLNPALGEIWAVPNYGIMVGRAGWVKKLTEKAAREDFRWWDQYTKLRPDEMKEYGLDPGKIAVAYRCEIRRSDTISVYVDSLKKLGEAVKMEYEQMIAMMGHPPVTVGIGVIYSFEDFGKNNRMTDDERCKKRAFAAGCRQIVDLPFAVASEGERVNGSAADYETTGAPQALLDDVIEGKAEPVTEIPAEAPEPPQGAVDGEVVEDGPNKPKAAPSEAQGGPTVTIHKAEIAERPWEPELTASYIRKKAARSATKMTGPASEQQATKLIIPIDVEFKDSPTQRTDRLAVLSYIVERELTSTKDLSKAEASAIIGWQTSAPPEVVAGELNRLLRAALKAEGQAEMELDDAAEPAAK